MSFLLCLSAVLHCLLSRLLSTLMSFRVGCVLHLQPFLAYFGCIHKATTRQIYYCRTSMVCAPRKDSYQTGHPPSLIRHFLLLHEGS